MTAYGSWVSYQGGQVISNNGKTIEYDYDFARTKLTLIDTPVYGQEGAVHYAGTIQRISTGNADGYRRQRLWLRMRDTVDTFSTQTFVVNNDPGPVYGTVTPWSWDTTEPFSNPLEDVHVYNPDTAGILCAFVFDVAPPAAQLAQDPPPELVASAGSAAGRVRTSPLHGPPRSL